MGKWQWFQWASGIVAVLLVAASQVSVEQAQKNITSWLRLVGDDRFPPWVATLHIDRWVGPLSMAYLALEIGYLVWRYRTARSDEAWMAEISAQSAPPINGPVGLEVAGNVRGNVFENLTVTASSAAIGSSTAVRASNQSKTKIGKLTTTAHTGIDARDSAEVEVADMKHAPAAKDES
jgi:hypothetical protein